MSVSVGNGLLVFDISGEPTRIQFCGYTRLTMVTVLMSAHPVPPIFELEHRHTPDESKCPVSIPDAEPHTEEEEEVAPMVLLHTPFIFCNDVTYLCVCVSLWLFYCA